MTSLATGRAPSHAAAAGGVLLLLMACSGSDGFERVPSRELSLTAPLDVQGFVILATNQVRVSDRTRLSGGHVGALAATGEAISAGSESHLSLGGAALGRRVVLGDRAAAGSVYAQELVAPFATVEALLPFEAPPTVPALAAFVAGSTPVVVASGQSRMLDAGAFGSVTVGGTLRLSGGSYAFADLRFTNDATLVADAPSVVRVAGRVTGEHRVRIGTAPALGASALRLIIAGTSVPAAGLSLGHDARLSALVLASAGLTAGDRLVGSGALGAANVVLGHDVRFDFDTGFECNTDAGCDDGNPCTTDACVDAQCAHAPRADDSACATPEGGAGTCQSATCVPVPSTQRIQAILAVCAGCHTGPTPSAGLDLGDIGVVRDSAALSARCSDALPILTPGDPSRSYLLLKVADTAACAVGRTNCGADTAQAACRLGQRMPRGLPALPASEIEEIRQWIVAGAGAMVMPSAR
jgi:hypothetical protein